MFDTFPHEPVQPFFTRRQTTWRYRSENHFPERNGEGKKKRRTRPGKLIKRPRPYKIRNSYGAGYGYRHGVLRLAYYYTYCEVLYRFRCTHRGFITRFNGHYFQFDLTARAGRTRGERKVAPPVFRPGGFTREEGRPSRNPVRRDR